MKIGQDVIIDLERMPDNKGEFDVFQGGVLETFLMDKAKQLAILATDNLNNADRVASGTLADSIAPREPVKAGKGVYIDVELASYYKFIDQGVNGTKTNRGAPYNYKPTRPSPNMKEALKAWLISEGSKQTKMKYKPITARETRRAVKPAKPMTIDQQAYQAAAGVKRKGQKRTLFWTNAIKEVEKDIAKTIGEKLTLVITSGIVR